MVTAGHNVPWPAVKKSGESGFLIWNLEGPLQATHVESMTKSLVIVPSDGPLVSASF